jgi:3-methyl-2-oxobutanoate hydroxymethyltransferase
MPTTVREFRAGTEAETPLTMLTAYDAPTAAACEAAGVDAILVGDSMGNATLGYDSTLPVTVEEVASRTGAVARATDEPLVIADMPFLSFGVDETESLRNAGRMLKEEGAHAVKIESGAHTVKLTQRLADVGIPVMAHLGLTPQKVNQLGYSRQGTSQEAASEIARLAREHENAGAFALVLEHVPANLAAAITDDLSIPTIGIGAGPDCDGQVLVANDVLGLGDRQPPFAEAFGDVRGEMEQAVSGYVEAVENEEFPAEEHSHAESDLDDPY